MRKFTVEFPVPDALVRTANALKRWQIALLAGVIGATAAGAIAFAVAPGVEFQPKETLTAEALNKRFDAVFEAARGSERSERASLRLSGTCEILHQSGSWLTSCARLDTGDYVMAIAVGTFSGVPSCVFTVGGSAGSSGGVLAVVDYNRVQSGNWEFLTVDAGWSQTDPAGGGFDVICQGPR